PAHRGPVGRRRRGASPPGRQRPRPPSPRPFGGPTLGQRALHSPAPAASILPVASRAVNARGACPTRACGVGGRKRGNYGSKRGRIPARRAAGGGTVAVI